MTLVTTVPGASLDSSHQDVRYIISTFQESAAMTKAEGEVLETEVERYQRETQMLVAAMYAENLKLQLALNEALRREESSSLIQTKTVETLQERVASLEATLQETRGAMLQQAEKAKEQMAQMTMGHAKALQTALAACKAEAAANQAVAVAAVQTRAQQRLSAAAQAVYGLDSGLQNDIRWYTAATPEQCAQWPGQKQAEYTRRTIPGILQQIQTPF